MCEENQDKSFLLDISTNIFFLVTKEGKIVYRNLRAKQIFDTDICLDNIFQIINDESSKKRISQILEYQFMDTLNIIHNYRNYIIYIYPYQQLFAVCMWDITENMQLSEHLQKVMKRLEFAEKTTHLGYWEFALSNRKIYWSAEMYRIFGISTQEVFEKHNIIKEHIFSEDLPIYKSKLKDLIRSKEPAEGTIRLIKPNKDIVYCYFKASLIKDGNELKIAGTFQDLTKLISTQIALDDARKQAEYLNKAKSYFLAQASHDLRQPMQSLKIFIDMLMNEKLSAYQSNILSKIHASSENLCSLLDNLLDFSKIESGGLEYQPRDFDINDLLIRLSGEFAELADDKGVSFKYIPCHQIINNDPLLIERIVRNLISNALKYTKDKIVIGCRSCGNFFQLIIMDNGVGISIKEQTKIFDEFYQSPQNPEQKNTGAGLGLTIVKKIADLISCKIIVKSKLGKGSSFILCFPQIKKGL